MQNDFTIKLITVLLAILYCEKIPLTAQIVIKTGASPSEMVQKVLLNNKSGIKIEEVKFKGSVLSIGEFHSVTKFLPITNGLVLSTGLVENIDGPNESTNMGSMRFTPGDDDLDRIAKGKTADAAILEFQFYPNTDEISFDYFFASEEYPEFVNHGVNDVFAFYISDPGFEKPVNIAILPSTGEPIAVDNINTDKNPSFYIENKLWNNSLILGPLMDAELSYSFEFDGMTKILEAKAKVVPYQLYHLKIAIADVGDNIFDSGVFIRANSLKSKGNNIPLANLIEQDLRTNLIQSEFITYKIDSNQVNIQSNVLFDFNSYELRTEYKVALDKLVGILNQYFDIQLHLVGHTDNIGTDKYNLELSVFRAQAIKNYLISKNIAENRISVEGKGTLEPLYSENSEKAKVINRRVEFILTKKKMTSFLKY